MDDSVITEQLMADLFNDLVDGENFFKAKPLLAHYTTIQNIERIIQNKELWFGNPLFMNDYEEVRFGLLEGERLLKSSSEVASACGSAQRTGALFEKFDFFARRYIENHLGDTYVFCTSRHDPSDTDGLLSMWRGYGGNGNGAAIVFDTSKMNNLAASPLIVAKVDYGTNDQRRAWIQSRIKVLCALLQRFNLPDDKLHLAAYAFHERLKLFALFSKHLGFREEQEWRVVYMRDRDFHGILTPMFGHSIGARGIEPRLKFAVAPIKDFTAPDLSLGKIVDRIVLGPSLNSTIAANTFKRMLNQHNEPELAQRVVASTIPFRA